MKATMVMSVTVAVYLACSCAALGQEHNDRDTACEVFKNASSPDLVQNLNGIVPDDKNAECVTFAIRKLGKERYEPAVTALVKLLDFRRPPTREEKMGFYERPPIVEETFPAAEALESIGKPALPEVLRAIEVASTSTIALENAIAVWMEAYKYERPKGVAFLKQEVTKANNDAIKQRLRGAVQKALRYCGSPEEEEGAACRQAAKGAL